MTAPTWYVGIDAGGTSTELLAHPSPAGEPIRFGGPAANLQRVGLEETCDVFADLVRHFQARSGARAASVCAGVAGAGRTDECAAVGERLRTVLGENAPDTIHIVHDGVIALEAAFEGDSGVITITGTGSLVLGRDRAGALLRAGGWGYLLGDAGSGFALGRAALQAIAASFDGGPETRLTALLAERHEITSSERLIQAVYGRKWAIPQMAPLVVHAAAEGDRIASEIVHAETTAIARQVRWVADRAAGIAEQIAPLGGLTHAPFYREALTRAFQHELPAWAVRQPAHEPVVGAVRLAKKEAAGDA